MNEEERQLEHSINEFRSYYEFSFKSLMKALNDANISHYSSGCGTKRVTFEIFPAASYVEEILRMLSIKRMFKTKTNNGFRDSTSKADYNPAHDFIMYMRRWSMFAEQAMRTEGASERGVAAARAKLIMHDLIESLSEGKNGLGLRTTHLAKLMFAIGKFLENRSKEDVEREHKINALQARSNYLEAMDAAQGALNRPKQQMMRASAS